MVQIYCGDCLDVLKGMPDCSIDSIVTDPPYGLSFMGKKWDHDVPTTELWNEALRVLKPGGHLLAFFGTRTYHRGAVRIEDAGFEIRDMVSWVYGSGFPKSHNLKEEWSGWGTALKPALEPITVARKPLAEKSVAANVLEYGTGALSIDGCRVDGEQWALGGAQSGGVTVTAYGDGLNNSGRSESHPAGRWPANLIHDGSDEVLSYFPYSKRQQGFVGQRHGDRTSVNAYGDYGPRPDAVPRGDSGSAARFFYCAKASKKDRDDGCDLLKIRRTVGGGGMNDKNGDDVCGKYGSVKSPGRNHHPTVKPTDLMRYLCRLVTQPGGVVLDPFMGSGSTGKAAMLEGFDFVGIDRDEQYVEIARSRIADAEKQAKANLFSQNQ